MFFFSNPSRRYYLAKTVITSIEMVSIESRSVSFKKRRKLVFIDQTNPPECMNRIRVENEGHPDAYVIVKP